MMYSFNRDTLYIYMYVYVQCTCADVNVYKAI